MTDAIRTLPMVVIDFSPAQDPRLVRVGEGAFGLSGASNKALFFAIESGARVEAPSTSRIIERPQPETFWLPRVSVADATIVLKLAKPHHLTKPHLHITLASAPEEPWEVALPGFVALEARDAMWAIEEEDVLVFEGRTFVAWVRLSALLGVCEMGMLSWTRRGANPYMDPTFRAAGRVIFSKHGVTNLDVAGTTVRVRTPGVIEVGSEVVLTGRHIDAVGTAHYEAIEVKSGERVELGAPPAGTDAFVSSALPLRDAPRKRGTLWELAAHAPGLTRLLERYFEEDPSRERDRVLCYEDSFWNETDDVIADLCRIAGGVPVLRQVKLRRGEIDVRDAKGKRDVLYIDMLQDVVDYFNEALKANGRDLRILAFHAGDVRSALVAMPSEMLARVGKESPMLDEDDCL